jgi:hypothetical protein
MNNSQYIQKIKYICCDRYIDADEKILKLQDSMKISMNPIYVSQIAELNEEIRLLQEQLKMKDETPTVANSVFVKNDEMVSKMKERVDDLVNHKKDLIKRNTELQEKIDEIESEMKELDTKYKHSITRNGGFAKQNQDLRDMVASLNKELDGKDVLIKRLQKTIKKIPPQPVEIGEIGLCRCCKTDKVIRHKGLQYCKMCKEKDSMEKRPIVECQICNKKCKSYIQKCNICKYCYGLVKKKHPNIKRLEDILDMESSISKASSKSQDEDSDTDSEIYE